LQLDRHVGTDYLYRLIRGRGAQASSKDLSRQLTRGTPL
jgi:hypothetical protein